MQLKRQIAELMEVSLNVKQGDSVSRHRSWIEVSVTLDNPGTAKPCQGAWLLLVGDSEGNTIRKERI